MKQICKKCYSINEVDDTNQHYICSKCNKKNRIIPQDNLVFEKFFKKANILFSEQTKYKESAKIFIKLHELYANQCDVLEYLVDENHIQNPCNLYMLQPKLYNHIHVHQEKTQQHNCSFPASNQVRATRLPMTSVSYNGVY